jgi:hypothetical protein
MSSSRNARRLAAKKGLAEVLNGLKVATDGIGKILPETEKEVFQATQLVSELLYRLERQRAIMIRLFNDPGLPIDEDGTELSEIVTAWEAEYDAMVFFVGLAKEAMQRDALRELTEESQRLGMY